MKKVLFTIVIIAILVGTALITLAPAPPTTVTLTTLDNKLKNIMGYVDELETKVNAIQSDLGIVEGNVTAIKTDVGTIKSDVDTVKGDVSALYTKVTDIGDNLTTVKTTVDSINGAIVTNAESVRDIHTHVVNLGTAVSGIKTYLGNVTKMETVYGSYEVLLFSGTDGVYEVQYDEPRHVSLTLQWDGLAVPTTEGIAVAAWVTGTPSWEESIVYICLPDYAANGIETVEFNADHWYISVRNDNVWSGYVYYAATVTYPLQP